jgi:hypothetical protein
MLYLWLKNNHLQLKKPIINLQIPFNNFNFSLNDIFWQNFNAYQNIVKKIIMIKKKHFWNFLWNIPRIKQSKK